MTQRSIHLPIYTMLIGLIIISVGFNIIAFGRLNQLHQTVNTVDSPVDEKELHKMMEEVKRLSKQTYTTGDSGVQYDVKTRKPIANDF